MGRPFDRPTVMVTLGYMCHAQPQPRELVVHPPCSGRTVPATTGGRVGQCRVG